jgi:uncharacterized protein YdhG (YjbR/CyaY superfamily)
MCRMPTMEEYLSALPDPQRDALARVRRAVAAAAPDAEEGESYGIPAFRWAGKPLLGLSASKAHLSVHPFSPAVVDAVRDRLAGLSVSRGTIRFSAEQPLPDGVVEELVALRMREISPPA